MVLKIALIVIPLAIIWRWLFWRYSTREKANRSWTLLSERDRTSFLNTATFMNVGVWFITSLITLDYLQEPVKDPLLLGAIVVLGILSILAPTIVSTLELRHQINQA